MPQSFKEYGRLLVRWLLPASFLLSFIPLSETYYLGNKGEPLLAPVAPLILCVASGLVCITWWVLSLLVWVINGGVRILFRRLDVIRRIYMNLLISVLTGGVKRLAFKKAPSPQWSQSSS